MYQKWLAVAGAIIALLVLVFVATFVKIPTGYTGIIVTFGKVSDTTLEAGAHFKSPLQSVVKMDNREQHQLVETMAFSKDIQEVKVIYSINYQIGKATAMNLYKDVGTNYYNILVLPRFQEALKNTFKKHTAAELIANRDGLSKDIKDDVSAALTDYGIGIISVFVEDIDFSDSYTDAVESKQVAEQVKLKAAIEQDVLTNAAEQTAQRELIQAEAQLERTKKEADAQAYSITQKANAEAEANIKLAQSITPELTSYLEVQKWDGKRVMEINGGVMPLMNIDDGISK